MRWFRTLRYLTVAAALAAFTAPLAQAHRSRHAGPFNERQATTFDGSCQLTGTVSFLPPLTSTPRPTRDAAFEQGTCSGTLTSHGHARSLGNQAVRYFATDSGQAESCGANAGASGWGFLAFARATVFFRLSETRATGVAQLSLTGLAGGSAQGVATISSSSNPVQIAEACVGSGLRSTPVDIRLQTTPAISG